MSHRLSLRVRLCNLAFSLILIGGFTFAASSSAHARGAAHTQASRPTQCGTDHVTFEGNNTDSTGVYNVSLWVHYVWAFGCDDDIYTETQAYVAEGYSFDIRVCTGQTPEFDHWNEVCNTYSGVAPHFGWYSPIFQSYHWSLNGCDGYADIQGHVGLASNILMTRGCPGF